MKYISYLLFLSLCAVCLAQDSTNEVVNPNTNRIVQFYADNLPYAGLTNYPKRIEDTSLTNVSRWLAHKLYRRCRI